MKTRRQTGRQDLAANPRGAQAVEFPEPGRREALYARMVSEIKHHGGLTIPEIASLTGTGERQVRNWTSGHHAPRPPARERLLELHYLVSLLRDVYTPEGAEIWLHGRKRSLGARRPIDLIAEGDYQAVLDAIERLRAGAM